MTLCHILPERRISPKVIVIAWLDFAYYDVAIQHLSQRDTCLAIYFCFFLWFKGISLPFLSVLLIMIVYRLPNFWFYWFGLECILVVLFQAIQLNGFKYCYVLPTIQLNISHLFTLLNVKTVLFQTIQFSISTHFSSIWSIYRTLSCATTPDRVDLRAMAIKGYSAFPKVPALLEPHNQIVWCHYKDNRWRWGSYPSAEIQHSTAPTDWTIFVIWSISFRCLLNSIKRVSYSHRIMISYITISEWTPIILWNFNCFFLAFVMTKRFFA